MFPLKTTEYNLGTFGTFQGWKLQSRLSAAATRYRKGPALASRQYRGGITDLDLFKPSTPLVRLDSWSSVGNGLFGWTQVMENKRPVRILYRGSNERGLSGGI